MLLEKIVCLDAHLFQLLNSHHSVFFDYFFQCLTQLGNAWVTVPLVIAIIVAATPRARLKRALVGALIAGSVAGILTPSIKNAVHRPRPLSYFAGQAPSLRQGGACTSVQAPYTVHVVGKPLYRKSFPSGHSATAFTAATILVALFGGYFYCAYIPALFVAYSRVYMGDHFPFDTVAGALLGIIVGFAVVAWCRERRPKPEGKNPC